ncbi:hypothetical protein B4100_3918 [Heyndrickxia coagulans]|nr:hypothetical protein B4100_3918 [Heyndrickxia coagulans]
MAVLRRFLFWLPEKKKEIVKKKQIIFSSSLKFRSIFSKT